VAGSADLPAHETLKLAIIGGEPEEGKIVFLKRESHEMWRQNTFAEL